MSTFVNINGISLGDSGSSVSGGGSGSAGISAHNLDPTAHPAFEFLKDVDYDQSTGIMTFTFRDNGTYTINIDFAELLKDLDYDPATKEIVITREDGTEVRIPVADLVDVYTGSNGQHIQITIGSGNTINAVLKAGTVTKVELASDVIAEFDKKLDKAVTTGDGKKAYTKENDGSQSMTAVVANAATPNTLPERNAGGNFAVGNPTTDSETVNKGYADGRYVRSVNDIKPDSAGDVKVMKKIDMTGYNNLQNNPSQISDGVEYILTDPPQTIIPGISFPPPPHNGLSGREASDCHPLFAITGMNKVLRPELFAYGIEIDTTKAATALTRIGNMDLHRQLPIQNQVRRCLVLDNGTINYWCDANNTDLKEDGTPANLTGADGQAMVYIPDYYYKFETSGTVTRAMFSELPLQGFKFHKHEFTSAYQAVTDRTNPSLIKLCSVVNTTPAFRGGNNNAAWDTETTTLLGRPSTSISLTNFRAYARNRGVYGLNGCGWNQGVYNTDLAWKWLLITEYANLNCQLPFNAALTSDGFRQGGLGDGVTTLASAAWSAWNGTYPFIPCGYTNSLGNKTGVVDFVMPAEYGTALTVKVPSWRGIENPFGHIWSWTDGCKCRVSAEAANGGTGLSEFFVANDPAKFQDVNYNDYENRGILPRIDGYIREVLMGEHGDIMAKVNTGASTTTFWSDYGYYSSLPASGESLRGVFFGGNAYYGASAGLAYSYTLNSPSNTAASIGSRLCFLPS